MARNTNTSKPATTPAKVADKTAPAKPAEPKPAPANCKCGCGAPTVTSKALFLSGHDARLAGRLGRQAATKEGLSDADVALLDSLTDRLQAKVETVRMTAIKKAVAKEAREQAKSVAKAAYEQAMADLLK